MKTYIEKLNIHFNTFVTVIGIACTTVLTVAGLYWGIINSLDKLTNTVKVGFSHIETKFAESDIRIARLENLHFGK